MTQINFNFGRPTADGIADLAGETVHMIPTERFTSGKRIVVRDSFETRLGDNGQASVTVPPTDNTFAYEVTIGDNQESWRFVRCVQVPDSATAVDFADLTDVDVSTLAPALNTGAALTYLLASSLAEAQTLSAANPGQMVFYPETDTTTVSTQILADLTDAKAVVETQAAETAQLANAVQLASDQVTANAVAVQTVMDAISESNATVESHATAAVASIDEAVKQVQDMASSATVAESSEPTSEPSTDTPATTDAAPQEA